MDTLLNSTLFESVLSTPAQDDFLVYEEDDSILGNVVNEEVVITAGHTPTGLRESFCDLLTDKAFADVSGPVNLDMVDDTIDLDFINDLLDNSSLPNLEPSSSNTSDSVVVSPGGSGSFQASLVEADPFSMFTTVVTVEHGYPEQIDHGFFDQRSSSGGGSPSSTVLKTVTAPSPSSSWFNFTQVLSSATSPPARKRKAPVRPSNKQSPLLPYSVQDTYEANSDEDGEGAINNEDIIHGNPGDPVILSVEEKRLLAKEGMTVFPTHLPLTRSEERLIRLVRRKMRNKKSAKLSRAKKQRYMGDLEVRVNHCSEENAALKRQARELQEEKSTLLKQVERLKEQLSYYMKLARENGAPLLNNLESIPGGAHVASRTTFCLFFLITFSFFFSSVMVPIPWKGAETKDGAVNFIPYPGRSRTLLSERELAMDVPSPYDVTVRPKALWLYPPVTASIRLDKISVSGKSRNDIVNNNTYSPDEELHRNRNLQDAPQVMPVKTVNDMEQVREL